jgi:hypothetical protein
MGYLWNVADGLSTVLGEQCGTASLFTIKFHIFTYYAVGDTAGMHKLSQILGSRRLT